MAAAYTFAGGWLAAGPEGVASRAVLYAAALTFVYSTTQEILYTIEDEQADRAAGKRTTAVRLGSHRTLRLFQVATAVTCAVALLPRLAGHASNHYLAAALATLVAPSL